MCVGDAIARAGALDEKDPTNSTTVFEVVAITSFHALPHDLVCNRKRATMIQPVTTASRRSAILRKAPHVPRLASRIEGVQLVSPEIWLWENFSNEFGIGCMCHLLQLQERNDGHAR
jgi:hypothetical protein